MNSDQLQTLDNLLGQVEPKEFFAGLESALRRKSTALYTQPGVGVLEVRKAVLLELNADVLRQMIDTPSNSLVL
jgi:hypothetical protein